MIEYIFLIYATALITWTAIAVILFAILPMDFFKFIGDGEDKYGFW